MTLARSLGALCLLLLLGCGDGRTPLVLYSPHGRDLLSLLETEYERLRPEIDVRWLDMGSQEIHDRIRSEAANPQADVWFGGPDTIFERGIEDGLLAPFRPSWAEAIPASAKHPDDLYFSVYQAVPILFFNSDAISAEDAPTDWDDLLAERFRGRVLIREPLASGTMRTAFGKVLADSVAETGDVEQGLEWLTRLDGQTKEYVQNPALLFEKLIRQEGDLTIWELTDAKFQQDRGVPLDYRFPASGTPIIDDAIGLVAGARRSEAARDFIEWVGGRDATLLAAREAYRLPARRDLAAEELPEWAREAIDAIVPAHVDWDLIAAESSGWMSRWDREVRGKG